MPIDLEPFGFTPTESLAYNALIDRGPTSAYNVSKTMGVARANVYQALNGLVSKGVATRVSDSPQVFRPVGPSALLAMVSQREVTKLERLEAQVAAHHEPGVETTFPFSSERSFRELALRLAVRASSVLCVGTSPVLCGLNPIWRKREADGVDTHLWVIGLVDQDLAGPVSGTIDALAATGYFGSNPALLVTPDAVIIGCEVEEGELRGYWSSDPVWIGAVKGTADAISGA